MSMAVVFKDRVQAQWQASALAGRWKALPPRDRLALMSLGGFLLLVLLYLALWRPAQQGVVSAREYFEQQRALHAYMQQQAPRARSSQEAPQASVEPERLQGLVTASAAEQGLSVERLDSDAPGQVQVSLQPTSFARLLRWFAGLEAQGVRIEETGLDRADEGQVTARLTLRVGG
ncbi:type II secretion system protein M [Pseudomonas tohonis]|uniref:type II secretion system protein M n=1 Tax=Pseudomonas tohonis TaxID=2725477 RepID=UPI003D80BDCD